MCGYDIGERQTVGWGCRRADAPQERPEPRFLLSTSYVALSGVDAEKMRAVGELAEGEGRNGSVTMGGGTCWGVDCVRNGREGGPYIMSPWLRRRERGPRSPRRAGAARASVDRKRKLARKA